MAAASQPVPAERGDRGAPSLARGVVRFAIDWFPVVVVIFAYDAIHNQLGRWIPPAHTFPQIRADQALFGAPVLAVRLQRAFYTPGHPHGWDYAALAVYTSHFVTAEAIALVLWFRARDEYLRFMAGFVALTTLGYITYVMFPAVPPWLASLHGDLAPTHRLVREMWEGLGAPGMAELFSGSNLHVNDVAAIPSLHAAYPVLIAVYLWGQARATARIALVAYALAMALTLIYAAEHYAVDILLGWLYVIPVALAMRWLRPPSSPGSR